MRRPTSRNARLALAVVALAACGSGQAASPDSSTIIVDDIGELPADPTPSGTSGPSTTESEPSTATPGVVPTSTVAAEAETEAEDALPIGRTVDGNRLLVIGDSILASISDRFGGQLCDRLVPLGWAVEVDAESGRDVTFGLDVLDDRLAAGWDAAVVMLGNNYRDDIGQFAADLASIVQRLAPRPTLLLTVTEFEPSRAEVNSVIRSIAADHDHVHVVEWADRTRDAEELLGDDGLHLSEEGREDLAWQVTRALLSVTGSGECLGSDYDDDLETAPTL